MCRMVYILHGKTCYSFHTVYDENINVPGIAEEITWLKETVHGSVVSKEQLALGFNTKAKAQFEVR